MLHVLLIIVLSYTCNNSSKFNVNTTHYRQKKILLVRIQHMKKEKRMLTRKKNKLRRSIFLLLVIKNVCSKSIHSLFNQLLQLLVLYHHHLIYLRQKKEKVMRLEKNKPPAPGPAPAPPSPPITLWKNRDKNFCILLTIKSLTIKFSHDW